MGPGEDWGRRPGFEKKVRLDESVFDALQTAAPWWFDVPGDVPWFSSLNNKGFQRQGSDYDRL